MLLSASWGKLRGPFKFPYVTAIHGTEGFKGCIFVFAYTVQSKKAWSEEGSSH